MDLGSYCPAFCSLYLGIYHVIPCAILPLESWSWPSELIWRKTSALCVMWWPQLWDFATADFSFIFPLLGYYLLCCGSLRSGCSMSLNCLQRRKLWNTKLWESTAEPVTQLRLLSVKNVKGSMQRSFRISDLRGYLKLLPEAHRWMKGLVKWRVLLEQM